MQGKVPQRYIKHYVQTYVHRTHPEPECGHTFTLLEMKNEKEIVHIRTLILVRRFHFFSIELLGSQEKTE